MITPVITLPLGIIIILDMQCIGGRVILASLAGVIGIHVGISIRGSSLCNIISLFMIEGCQMPLAADAAAAAVPLLMLQ